MQHISNEKEFINTRIKRFAKYLFLFIAGTLKCLLAGLTTLKCLLAGQGKICALCDTIQLLQKAG